MREIRASVAKTRLSELLTDVERGESIVITRHGRAIARIVPEAEGRQADWRKLKEEIEQFRKTMPRMSVEEILSARDEGRKR